MPALKPRQAFSGRRNKGTKAQVLENVIGLLDHLGQSQFGNFRGEPLEDGVSHVGYCRKSSLSCGW